MLLLGLEISTWYTYFTNQIIPDYDIIRIKSFTKTLTAIQKRQE